MAGETGPITVSLPMAMAIAGFFAISIYNTAEILIWIAHTFKRRTSLYFWSLLIASAGIPIHAVGVLLRFFALAPNLPMCVVIIIGWQAMVTGQSVVLFSRLHLVVSNSLKIRWVLVMIVVNYFVLHVPVSVLFLASNSASPDNFIGPFNIYEKIQLAGFSVQETIISGLYLWETVYGLKPVLEIKGADGKRITRHLLLLFIVVVILDSSLMATEYTNNFQIQTTYKPVVYSIKLKIEFVILNELINVTRATSYGSLGSTGFAFDSTHSKSVHIISSNRTVRSDAAQHDLHMEMGPVKRTVADPSSMTVSGPAAFITSFPHPTHPCPLAVA